MSQFALLVTQLAESLGREHLTPSQLQGLENARIVLEQITRKPGIGCTELEQRLGMSRQCVIKHCKALAASGKVIRSADRLGGWLPKPRKPQ